MNKTTAVPATAPPTGTRSTKSSSPGSGGDFAATLLNTTARTATAEGQHKTKADTSTAAPGKNAERAASEQADGARKHADKAKATDDKAKPADAQAKPADAQPTVADGQAKPVAQDAAMPAPAPADGQPAVDPTQAPAAAPADPTAAPQPPVPPVPPVPAAPAATAPAPAPVAPAPAPAADAPKADPAAAPLPLPTPDASGQPGAKDAGKDATPSAPSAQPDGHDAPAAQAIAPDAVKAAATATPDADPAAPKADAPKADAAQTATPQASTPATAAPATTAPVAPAPPAAPIATPQGFEAVRLPVRGDEVRALLRIAQHRGQAQAQLSLHPAELGGVEVRLRVTSQGLMATIKADRPEAAQVLQQAGADLRRALEAQGIDLAGLDFGLTGDGADAGNPRAGERGAEGPAGRGTRRADATDELLPIDPDHPTTTAPTLALGAIVDVIA